MYKIICFVLGHSWLPVVITKEWWHGYEDIGPNGGLTMAYSPCRETDEDAFESEFESRTCSYCGKVEWV